LPSGIPGQRVVGRQADPLDHQRARAGLERALGQRAIDVGAA
jgi:hypothetical protein